MEEPKSKTQKKRDADALQQLGVKLIDLSVEKLAALPLTEALKKAILEAKKLRSHGAVRRQAQLIGKLMRAADSEPIIAAYEQLMAEHNAQTVAFQEVEHWRLKLITGGKDALTEFIASYQPDDIQHLRQLLNKAVIEYNNQQNKGAQKALFRYLRSYLT